MKYQSTIGTKLKDFRKENNLTQRKVSEMLNVHITQVGLWESGRFNPNDRNKAKIEKLFEEYDRNISITKNLKIKVVNEKDLLGKTLRILNNENNNENITTLQLLDVINTIRSSFGIKTELLHKTLLSIIRDEFEEEIAEQKILPGSYKDLQNQERPMFNLTLSQAKQVLIRESKQVRRLVIKVLELQEEMIMELKAKDNKLDRFNNIITERPTLKTINSILKLAFYERNLEDKKKILDVVCSLLDTK